MKKIWILEDDVASHFVYEEIFNLRYSITFFENTKDFKTALESKASKPDLVIADLKLPGKSFLDFLASADTETVFSFPFMIVSSVDDIDILRTCFEEGALDFISKPFGKSELIYKVEQIFNKNNNTKNIQNDSNLIIDPTTMKVTRGDNLFALLTAKELQILSAFIQSPTKEITRKKLVASVWGIVHVGSKTLDVHLFNLRKKLININTEIKFIQPDIFRLIESSKLVAISSPSDSNDFNDIYSQRL